ncbi:hypothetical protein [Sphingomonas rubra]|uniref:hypothetical protein n=1 Tax=Sphingomonas rubra TaxID=634430 RepID=UPI0015A6426E|nr:hypothetical protein [Sphingomonas rubra]
MTGVDTWYAHRKSVGQFEPSGAPDARFAVSSHAAMNEGQLSEIEKVLLNV